MLRRRSIRSFVDQPVEQWMLFLVALFAKVPGEYHGGRRLSIVDGIADLLLRERASREEVIFRKSCEDLIISERERTPFFFCHHN